MKKAAMIGIALSILLTACGSSDSGGSSEVEPSAIVRETESPVGSETTDFSGRFQKEDEIAGAVENLKNEILPLERQFGKYDFNNESSYYGELSNGMPGGIGRMNYDDSPTGKFYYGEFTDGVARGVGVIRYGSSSLPDVYVGGIEFGRPSGQGIYYNLGTKETVIGTFADRSLLPEGDGAESASGDRVDLQDGRTYVGETSNGLPHGKGRMSLFSFGSYDRDFFIYEGEFERGKAVAPSYAEGERTYGVYALESGALYVGQLLNGLPDGWGTYVYEDQVISAQFAGGKTSGKGIIDDGKGNVYVGSLTLSYPNGQGIQFSGIGESLEYYIGDFVQGVPNGKGLSRNADELRIGEMKNNRLNGLGEYSSTFAGESYQGEFVDGEPSGFGVSRKSDGSAYVGEFKAGQLDGKGTMKTSDGSSFTGRFSGGQYIE